MSCEATGIVYLNVGGIVFPCTRETLCNRGENFFCALCRRVENVSEHFVDRDPSYFRYILNYLRGPIALPTDLNVLEELRIEADFYAMTDLVGEIERQQKQCPPSVNVMLARIERILARTYR